MDITISPHFRQQWPATQLAYIAWQLGSHADAAGLARLLSETSADVASSALDDILSTNAIASTRRAYAALGKDPSRYRGSAEALARRSLKGQPPRSVNAVVDLNNILSLRTLLPVGSYDRMRIEGPILFRVGDAGESYESFGKTLNVESLPVFADAAGSFGSTTGDSMRTLISAETTAVLTVLISFGSDPGWSSVLEMATHLIVEHANGTIVDTGVAAQ